MKRAGILDEMMAECRRYIGGEFLDVLKALSGEVLGATGAWSLHVSDQDPNVVQFRYPTAITKNLDYVSPQVVFELGTHAEFVRMIALRSVHSPPKNFRMLLPMETLWWSRCSRTGPFGRRQQFFMRNTSAAGETDPRPLFASLL
jgi:hypothetical protein